MDCVPHLMYQNGRLAVMNLQLGHSKELTCSYRISKSGEHMLIKEWKKCLDIRKEVLGSKRKRSARIGDRMISILHNGESGSILFMLFYLKEGISVLPNTDDHVPRTIK